MSRFLPRFLLFGPRGRGRPVPDCLPFDWAADWVSEQDASPRESFTVPTTTDVSRGAEARLPLMKFGLGSRCLLARGRAILADAGKPRARAMMMDRRAGSPNLSFFFSRRWLHSGLCRLHREIPTAAFRAQPGPGRRGTGNWVTALGRTSQMKRARPLNRRGSSTSKETLSLVILFFPPRGCSLHK